MPKNKKMTRRKKVELSKSRICWKCGRKLKGTEILCANCQGKEDKKEWEN